MSFRRCAEQDVPPRPCGTIARVQGSGIVVCAFVLSACSASPAPLDVSLSDVSPSTHVAPPPRSEATEIAAPEWASVTPVPAGRYTVLLHATSVGGCSQSTFSSNHASRIELELRKDGRVSGCRARMYHSAMTSFDPGSSPDVTVIVEQRGLLGRAERRGPWLDIDLGFDDSICPRIAGADPVPFALGGRRIEAPSVPWKLSCIGVAPRTARLPELAPTVPVVACRIHDGKYPNDVAYAVKVPFDFFPSREPDGAWFFLGGGHGLLVEERGFGGMDPTPHRRLEAASSPIAPDGWRPDKPAPTLVGSPGP